LSTVPLNTYSISISTPLGTLAAYATDHAVYRLAFADQATPPNKPNGILTQLRNELQEYFAGARTTFTVPLEPQGTSFQKEVWQTLLRIPSGTTCSYKEVAHALGKPTAFRAVALANKYNPIALIIPCHRVIKSNGDICGYNGGIERKQWLLAHEAA
jgi:methylated-DNA-[protein]-cysteine S-methyltransferase